MTRLQLHLSARGLKNLSGLMGMSDPFSIVTVRGDSENNKPQVVGQTDVYVQQNTHLIPSEHEPLVLSSSLTRFTVYSTI